MLTSDEVKTGSAGDKLETGSEVNVNGREASLKMSTEEVVIVNHALAVTGLEEMLKTSRLEYDYAVYTDVLSKVNVDAKPKEKSSHTKKDLPLKACFKKGI